MRDQVVLVLCGLVGSGKSTFAQALERHCPNEWVRCCQDELKYRKAVETLVEQTLEKGLSAVVDRTNVSAEQRSIWISIAQKHKVPAWLLFMNTPPEICAQRVKTRTDHPTVKAGEGLWLIRQFGAKFEPPTTSEGFDRILELRDSPSPEAMFTAADTSVIIERLSNSQLDSDTSLVLSGPLPASEKKAKTPKKPTIHGRDIRSMFPLKSEELSRRRARR